MLYYRLYSLNRRDGFCSFVEIECEDDDRAIAYARETLADRSLELWNQARKVARFEPGGRETIEAQRAKPGVSALA